MIEARAITKQYNGHAVLDGASLAVRSGECVILTGDNGSGKTTLVHVLMGLRRADAGDIIWQEKQLPPTRRAAWRRAREAWGFLPQQVGFRIGAMVGLEAVPFDAAELETGRWVFQNIMLVTVGVFAMWLALLFPAATWALGRRQY